MARRPGSTARGQASPYRQARAEHRDRRHMAGAASELVLEGAGERGAVVRPGLLVALAPGSCDAHVDAATIVRAHAALGQTIPLEPSDDARERTLAEVQRLAELLHPALLLELLAGQTLEHLVLAHAELVKLERALERPVHASVHGQQRMPAIDEDRVVGERHRADR